MPNVGLPPCPSPSCHAWRPTEAGHAQTFSVFASCSAPRMLKLSRQTARSLSRCAYWLAGLRGSALDCFRDRRCANRQRHFVIDEGKLMGENVLPHLGIQESLTRT